MQQQMHRNITKLSMTQRAAMISPSASPEIEIAKRFRGTFKNNRQRVNELVKS